MILNQELLRLSIMIINCNPDESITYNSEIKLKFLNIISNYIIYSKINFQKEVSSNIPLFFNKVSELSIFIKNKLKITDYSIHDIVTVSILNSSGYIEYCKVSPNFNISERFISVIIESLFKLVNLLIKSFKNFLELRTTKNY